MESQLMDGQTRLHLRQQRIFHNPRTSYVHLQVFEMTMIEVHFLVYRMLVHEVFEYHSTTGGPGFCGTHAKLQL